MTSTNETDLLTEWRRVVCAAVRHPETKRIIVGVRHYDALMLDQMKAAEGTEAWKGCEQGFVDTHGNFLTREEALVNARWNDQIRRRCGGDGKELFSENLY